LFEKQWIGRSTLHEYVDFIILPECTLKKLSKSKISWKFGSFVDLKFNFKICNEGWETFKNSLLIKKKKKKLKWFDKLSFQTICKSSLNALKSKNEEKLSQDNRTFWLDISAVDAWFLTSMEIHPLSDSLALALFFAFHQNFPNKKAFFVELLKTLYEHSFAFKLSIGHKMCKKVRAFLIVFFSLQIFWNWNV
jgi:hypothetical protein